MVYAPFPLFTAVGKKEMRALNKLGGSCESVAPLSGNMAWLYVEVVRIVDCVAPGWVMPTDVM